MRVGALALDRLGALSHPLIAEVRGAGLFFGVEFQHEGGRPASEFCAQVVEGMRERGVLLNRIGREGNVLKMRPPMPFGEDHLDLTISALEETLEATAYE